MKPSMQFFFSNRTNMAFFSSWNPFRKSNASSWVPAISLSSGGHSYESTANVVFFLSMICLLVGVVWLFIEGNIVRQEYVARSERKANRVIMATLISVLGIILLLGWGALGFSS